MLGIAVAGHTSAAGWLAHLAGIPFGRAKATIETGTRLVQAPDDVDRAVRDGELSVDQTDEVTRGAEADRRVGLLASRAPP